MASISKAMQCLLLVTTVHLLAFYSRCALCRSVEVEALITLKGSLNDPMGVLHSWDPTLVDPCTWPHVTCDGSSRVTRLDLGFNGLSGHLVPDLGSLENLQYLELYKNNIQGTIPEELGNMKSLVSLDLFNNDLIGSIPSSLGNFKSLRFLRLNDNKLTASIPQAIVDIPTLQVLDLSTNNLSGAVPGPIAHIGFTNFSNNPRLGHPPVRVVPKLHGI